MRIKRDTNGFLEEKQRQEMFRCLPIVVGDGTDADWQLVTRASWDDWQAELEKPDRYPCWARVEIKDFPKRH